MMYGINMFRLKFLCLLGDFFATGFPRRIVRRRVLQHDVNQCVGGCNLQETATHLFLNCDTFHNLWVSVSQWLNIDFVAPEVLRAHLIQFGHLAGLPRFTYSFLKLIWLACVWVIWKERNNHVFNQKASEL